MISACCLVCTGNVVFERHGTGGNSEFGLFLCFSSTYPKNRITLCLWIIPNFISTFSLQLFLFFPSLFLQAKPCHGIFVIFDSSHVESCMARGCKISPLKRKKKSGFLFMNHYPRTWHIFIFYIEL